ncbi:hypothetical protein EV401DRAFT_885685 [Pisolithus croceorrhizus]|nr:hypothetical protein EV401DRAFT_885685 [Pisolithus croceorrhizus]
MFDVPDLLISSFLAGLRLFTVINSHCSHHFGFLMAAMVVFGACSKCVSGGSSDLLSPSRERRTSTSSDTQAVACTSLPTVNVGSCYFYYQTLTEIPLCLFSMKRPSTEEES